jgi:hypothetical protein
MLPSPAAATMTVAHAVAWSITATSDPDLCALRCHPPLDALKLVAAAGLGIGWALRSVVLTVADRVRLVGFDVGVVVGEHGGRKQRHCRNCDAEERCLHAGSDATVRNLFTTLRA